MSLNQNKYSKNNPFTLKQSNTNYNYHIINEGFYPSNSKIYYTLAHSHSETKYKIPDNYLVQTSWGREKSQHIIECEIEYDLDGPVFRIRFNENSQHYVIESKEFLTAVANNYLQKKNPNTNAKLSGIHIFGLNATDTKRSRRFSIQISEAFENKIPKFYNSFDRPVLQKDIEEEISQYIGKAGYRRVNDILLFIIPGLVARNVLNVNNPVINIHISGDGRNVGRKIKHVMITCTILDDISNIHKADSHHTIILYLEGENYKMLQKSEFFNNRTSQTLNLPPPGHLKVPLLPMISLNHYVSDELHIMLRIWDCLWKLVIQELKSENRFNNHVRAIINVEMQRISVGFYFWQDYVQSWHYTSLIEDDKEKVLCDFNFEVIFDKERAILINHL
ncbi:8930_t:CDS:2 [Cetraspora pellucida]|uniref:8930_t:CDS:1 n=1 Tax=Cetraspora pellucida TaxID=1433469 RepID=A0A9N9BVC7_9GLOM|nr:8930_t:CDS:2 [Cetraspora pellucida]